MPLAGSIDDVVRASVELSGAPAVHTAWSGLMAELLSEPGLSARLLGRQKDSTYQLLQHFLDDAAAERPAARGVDARVLVDMIGGTVLMALANERVIDDAWIEQTSALIVGGAAR